MADKLTVGGLFSGVGGFELGLERAGMEIAWHCEVDPFCRKVLAKHWPSVPCYGDVCGLTGANLRPVDVICGGPPCQPVSGAGLGLGDEDERWLWPDTLRLIGELRPRYALLENPAILLRRGAGGIFGTLAELGYDAEWEVVSACSFGAPHTRRRVFIMAYSDATGWDRRGRRPHHATQGPRAVEPTGCRPNSTWAQIPTSDLRGVANGIPNRMDRVASLGNAIVPQIAEWIGRRIVEYERSLSTAER